MASFRELLKQTKAQIREVDTTTAEGAIASRPETVVLDVREPDEYEQGALPGAVHIPRGHLESQVENRISRDAPVVVYCAGGIRSAFAAKTLTDLGYTREEADQIASQSRQAAPAMREPGAQQQAEATAKRAADQAAAGGAVASWIAFGIALLSLGGGALGGMLGAIGEQRQVVRYTRRFTPSEPTHAEPVR